MKTLFFVECKEGNDPTLYAGEVDLQGRIFIEGKTLSTTFSYDLLRGTIRLLGNGEVRLNRVHEDRLLVTAAQDRAIAQLEMWQKAQKA